MERTLHLTAVPAAQPGAVRTVVAAASQESLVRLRAASDACGFVVCGQAMESGAAVAAALAERPDLCVLHMGMPGDVLGAVRAIVAELPTTPVAVIVRSASERGLTAALAAGAAAYVAETSGPERLTAALEAAVAGDLTVPRPIMRSLAERLQRYESHVPGLRLPERRTARLTAREREVLDATLAGWSTADIAKTLSLSPVTVRRHATSAMRKLDLPSREALHSVTSSPRAPEREAPPAEGSAIRSPLTKRQLAVLRLVAAGMPNQEIAAELVISPNTVKNHITHLLEKLGARNRADAVRLAARHGWL